MFVWSFPQIRFCITAILIMTVGIAGGEDLDKKHTETKPPAASERATAGMQKGTPELLSRLLAEWVQSENGEDFDLRYKNEKHLIARIQNYNWSNVDVPKVYQDFITRTKNDNELLVRNAVIPEPSLFNATNSSAAFLIKELNKKDAPNSLQGAVGYPLLEIVVFENKLSQEDKAGLGKAIFDVYKKDVERNGRLLQLATQLGSVGGFNSAQATIESFLKSGATPNREDFQHAVFAVLAFESQNSGLKTSRERLLAKILGSNRVEAYVKEKIRGFKP